MKTDNELIAEFMGEATAFKTLPESWKKIIRAQCNLRYDVPQYDSSWDWLMPVVFKINTLPPHYSNPLRDEYVSLITLPLYTPISEVFESVVAFIKAYNTQNSTAYTSDNISTSSDIDKVK